MRFLLLLRADRRGRARCLQLLARLREERARWGCLFKLIGAGLYVIGAADRHQQSVLSALWSGLRVGDRIGRYVGAAA